MAQAVVIASSLGAPRAFTTTITHTGASRPRQALDARRVVRPPRQQVIAGAETVLPVTTAEAMTVAVRPKTPDWGAGADYPVFEPREEGNDNPFLPRLETLRCPPLHRDTICSSRR